MGEDSHHPGLPGGPTTDDVGGFLLDAAGGSAWLAIAVLYLVAGRAAALRGRPVWPTSRSAAWLVGAALGFAVTVGPLARAAHDNFPAHMAVHLVLGMLVPLLLVLGAPVTLFLRAVPARVGRRYSGIARAAVIRFLAHPITGLVLTTVPLALVYWNGTSQQLVHHPVLGPLIHLHFVAAGVLFTYAVIGSDPNPHRAPAWVRGGAIVAGIAAHGVVAKRMFATGQQGVPLADAEHGAQLMYYGGDAVHVVVLVVFCTQIYRSSGRRLAEPVPAWQQHRAVHGAPVPRARTGGLSQYRGAPPVHLPGVDRAGSRNL